MTGYYSTTLRKRENIYNIMSVQFNSICFAEGRFRRAYKGTRILPLYRYGEQCVVKELKENYTWSPTDWDTTIKIYDRARLLAENFNTMFNVGNHIIFTDVEVHKVTQKFDSFRPKLNEYVVVEDYISGLFQKWCNNYGYISDQAKTCDPVMPAFVHWSWVYTQGQEMIADIQGVHQLFNYHLTDPAMLSLSSNYGSTDTGIEGMAMFFLNHECNNYCMGLKKPTLSDFVGKLSPGILTECKLMQQRVNTSTTFNWEMKFPQRVKPLVTQVFTRIAQGY